MRHLQPLLLLPLILCAVMPRAHAQDNYEIQVYGSETVLPKTLMVEVHSNYTIDGFKPAPNSRFTYEGLYPTNHADHETLELTLGTTRWSEVGFYVFTSYREGQGYQWVGDHIRPRVRAPESWHIPVGLSLSAEVGYQRARFSPDSWTIELRPIIDKQYRRYYFAFNPTLDRAFHGPGVHDGVVFAPNIKGGYDFTKKINAGIEYYGSTGPVFGGSSYQPQHQIFAATDLTLNPKWEVNLGVGVGVTGSTDHLIVKTIIGRRFAWGRHDVEPPYSVK